MLPRTFAIATLIMALGNGTAHAQTTAPATKPATMSATTSEAASKGLSAERAEEVANLVTRDKLEGNLKEIISDHQSLEKLLNYLADNIGAKIDVNWPTLETAGITRTTPVSVSLREVPFRKALATILAQAGDGKNNLAYTVEAGTILVSTRDDLQSEKHQADRTYDIRAMLTLDAKGDKFSPQAAANIIDTIKSTVAPDSWKDNKGIGTITEKTGILTVHQTRDNLVAVNNLLAQLYETRAIQIAVESRLLLVSDGFLDDFPIGWDRKIANNSPATRPAATAPTTAKADAPSADFLATIMDNRALSLLLQAAQADKRTISVTSPRVTILNGHTESLATAKIYGDPAVRSAGTFDLTPTVSADRRMVIIDVGNFAINSTKAAGPETAPADRKPTRISVPDGGTLIINLAQVGLVPKDKRSSLLLIRPNIIIHREIENDLFGPGYDRPTGFPSGDLP